MYFIWLFLFLVAPGAEACSIFAASDGNEVLVGNNEDDPVTADFLGAQVAFTPAGDDRRFGTMHYFFGDGYPQGGLNTAGLFYDINALPQMAPPRYPAELPEYPGAPGSILLRMLATKETVTEALALLQSYRLDRHGVKVGQVFVADRHGDAAVLGIGPGGTVTAIRKTENFLLSTNFNLNHPVENYPEPRFELAERLWGENPVVSHANFRKILSAIHFDGSPATIYSQIYDLKRTEATFFLFHDFENGVRINLAAELARRGAATLPIAELFPYEPFSLRVARESLKVDGGNTPPRR